MAMSVKKNYIYNLLYQLTTVLLPLITMPYVSRILKDDGIAINALTNANTQYFILLGTLGVTIYATKKIATVREKRERLRQTFWEIFLIQFLGCLLAYIVFILTLGRTSQYGVYYVLQGFFILASAVDISWFFLGMENFKNASIRSFLVKIISVILIFIFVKTSADLGKYIFINSFTMLMGQIIMWAYIDKDILDIKKVKSLKSSKHIIPILSLFIPQIATQVYTVLDKTMIDLLSTTIQVGYYDQSQKIVRILLALVTSLGTVMMPKIANLYSKNDLIEVKKYLKKGFVVISFLAIPISLGIMGISDRFIPMFFGRRFISVVPLTELSAVLIIIIGLGNVFGTQYMLAVGKNSEYTKSVCIGAIVNLILNLILIPQFAALGAVIATISAELSIALVQVWYSRKIIDASWIKSTYKYWLSGIIMLAVVLFIGRSDAKRLVVISEQVIVGALVYFGVLLVVRDQFLIDCIKSFLERIGLKK